MGLKEVNSKLSKIVKLTESAVTGHIGNVKIPKVIIGSSLGIEAEEVTTIEGLLSSVKQSAQNLIQITKQIACLKYLGTDPGHVAASLLGGMAGSIANVASTLAMQIVTAFSTQISIAIDQILGTATGVITTIANLLVAIKNLAQAISAIPDKFRELGNFNVNWLMSREECEAMFANIAACYMMKFLNKTKLFDTVNKITNKINEYGSEMNEEIANELNDVNVMNNYIQKESFMLNKASIQMNNFHFYNV